MAGIEEAAADQLPAILAVHRAAFGGDYEAGVVAALVGGGHAVLSLVARDGVSLSGHVLFSRLDARIGAVPLDVVVLAPLAVAPPAQGKGIGAALVREGLARITARGHTAVVVRGDPQFYSRFGFSAALAENLDAPWSGPTYQAMELVPGALARGRCRLVYPAPFRVP